MTKEMLLFKEGAFVEEAEGCRGHVFCQHSRGFFT